MKTLLSIGLLFTTAAAFAAYNPNTGDPTGGAYDATRNATTGLGSSLAPTPVSDPTGTAEDALNRYGYTGSMRPMGRSASYRSHQMGSSNRPDFTTMGGAGTTETSTVDGTMAPASETGTM